jgi:hypothetical protein
MNNVKLIGVTILAGLAIVVMFVVGYRFFGPPPPLPKARSVSIADLARMEQKDPKSLTDVQRKLLATIPPDEKQRLLTKPSFSLSQLRTMQQAAHN